MDKRVTDIFMLGRPGRETDRARCTVELAVKCADEFGDAVFDSCHWLAGMYREGNGVAYHVLDNLGVTQSQIDDSIRSRERHTAPSFRVANDIRLLLDGAFAAAAEMSHSYIGTEHLLIGATADGTRSALLFGDLGLDPRNVENEVFYLLGHRLSD